jgi:cyclopropane-fatty-acyl-phospholipid synthase
MATTELRPQPANDAGPSGGAVARELITRLFTGVERRVSVALSGGPTLYAPPGPVDATIVIRHPGVLRALITRSSDLAAGAAVAQGDIAVNGDVEQAFAAMDAVATTRSPADWMAIAALAARLPRLPASQRVPRGRGPARLRGRVHSLERDRAAIAYHYDVSNKFFALWLGREMAYSCAYFREPSDSLDDAQTAKLDLICRKLRLRAGERLLDVGCGWGSLVRFAARRYGAHAVGVTLSARQAEYARMRIRAEGLDDRCRIELRDYRELDPLGEFDKAASVGMVEHVGAVLLPVYFEAVLAALKPGGAFLNHGIIIQGARERGFGRYFSHGSRFIEQYVFPDGEIPRLAPMTEAASDAGFEVRDVENLREHYVLTLRHWSRGLERHADEARRLVGDEAYNVWRLYSGCSAHNFAMGRMGVVQMLLAKPAPDGSASVPLTRADIYS